MKPTCLSRPLSASSTHNVNIHRHWPVQALKKNMLLCTRWLDAANIKRTIIRKFAEAGSDPVTLQLLHDEPVISYNMVRHVKTKSTSEFVRAHGSKKIWTVMGYHPDTITALRKAISTVNHDTNLNASWRHMMRKVDKRTGIVGKSRYSDSSLGLSLKNIMPNAVAELSRLNKKET